MNSYELIATQFHQRIDSIAGAVDTMAPGLEAASALLVQAVLDDRKVLVVATGQDALLGETLAETLRGPDAAAPPLPALAFTGSSNIDPAKLWRDLRTISRDGDVLIALDTGTDAPLLQSAAEFANERNLVAIGLSETQDSDCAATITLLAQDPRLRKELGLMAVHVLQEQVRQYLMGA
ncbi:MAG: phosphoheptose isomerase [Pseudomonadota bacterium]